MPTNTTAYDIGDMVRLSWVVKSTGGTPTNSAVTLTVQTATGGITKYGPVSTTNSTVIAHTGTGAWNRTITFNSKGRWTYEWKSTGAIQLTTGGAFAVRPRYITT